MPLVYSMIKIENLKKHFGSKHILDGVNLEIKDGEVTTIIGGSGTGKSTLIKCIIRLLEPDGGKIIVDGKDITHLNNEFELAKLRNSLEALQQENSRRNLGGAEQKTSREQVQEIFRHLY